MHCSASIFVSTINNLNRLANLAVPRHSIPVQDITALSQEICEAADFHQSRFTQESYRAIDLSINGHLAKNLGPQFKHSERIAAQIKNKGIQTISLINPNPIFVSLLLKGLAEDPLDKLTNTFKPEYGFSVAATKDKIEKTDLRLIFVSI